MDVTFPGESAEYRAARDRLLEQEIELRRADGGGRRGAGASSRPAARSRRTTSSRARGADGEPMDVRLSELFAPGKDSLAIYSFMFPRDPEDDAAGPGSRAGRPRLPLAEGPCPSCVACSTSSTGWPSTPAST